MRGTQERVDKMNFASAPTVFPCQMEGMRFELPTWNAFWEITADSVQVGKVHQCWPKHGRLVQCRKPLDAPQSHTSRVNATANAVDRRQAGYVWFWPLWLAVFVGTVSRLERPTSDDTGIPGFLASPTILFLVVPLRGRIYDARPLHIADYRDMTEANVNFWRQDATRVRLWGPTTLQIQAVCAPRFLDDPARSATVASRDFNIHVSLTLFQTRTGG
jgi:hypothetical protein